MIEPSSVLKTFNVKLKTGMRQIKSAQKVMKGESYQRISLSTLKNSKMRKGSYNYKWRAVNDIVTLIVTVKTDLISCAK